MPGVVREPLEELGRADRQAAVVVDDRLCDQQVGAREHLVERCEVVGPDLVHGGQPQGLDVAVRAGVQQQPQRLGLAVPEDDQQRAGAQRPGSSGTAPGSSPGCGVGTWIGAGSPLGTTSGSGVGSGGVAVMGPVYQRALLGVTCEGVPRPVAGTGRASPGVPRPMAPDQRTERSDPHGPERLTRTRNELLQELRVVQTGVQILTGFPLSVPSSSRFPDLDRFHVTAHLVVLAGAALAGWCATPTAPPAPAWPVVAGRLALTAGLVFHAVLWAAAPLVAVDHPGD